MSRSDVSSLKLDVRKSSTVCLMHMCLCCWWCQWWCCCQQYVQKEARSCDRGRACRLASLTEEAAHSWHLYCSSCWVFKTGFLLAWACFFFVFSFFCYARICNAFHIMHIMHLHTAFQWMRQQQPCLVLVIPVKLCCSCFYHIIFFKALFQLHCTDQSPAGLYSVPITW